MKPAAALHPSPDCLRLFGTGQLSADEAASVEAHVSDCPDCGGALRSVADDPFVDLVRPFGRFLNDGRHARHGE